MACLTTVRKAEIQARLDKYTARLALAETYFDFLMDSEGMESFKFDSGEAMSWAKYTKIDEFLLKVVYPLEAFIDHYTNKLNGKGIVRLNLSRRR